VKVLDCESIESTYSSLESILGLCKNEVQRFFNCVDVYESGPENPPKYLLSYIQEKTSCKTDFDASYWYHATRTWPDNNFNEGLLPLSQAFGKILGFLSGLIKNELTSQELRNSVFSNRSYSAELLRMKLLDPKIHGGPYGFLIREMAFVHNSAYVDYFASPESVEDICRSCDKVNLTELYESKTVPCVVKFIDMQTSLNALDTALLYAYHSHHGLPLDECEDWLTRCFNGHGVPVPKENIVKIEFCPR